MKINWHLFLIFTLLLLALSACQQSAPLPTPTLAPPPPASPTAPQPASPSATSPVLPTSTQPPSATAPAGASGVRTCDFIPGKSTPLLIPPANPVVEASPTPMTFKTGDTSSQDREMTAFNQIVKEINDNYYSTDFNGVNWTAIQAKYKALIQKGLTLPDFYQSMVQMVGELGDHTSTYHGPSDSTTQTTPSGTFVGIGGAFDGINDNGQYIHVLNWVYSGSPAEKAGLKSHDLLLKVDGGPFMDDKGRPRTLGTEGSTLVLTVQTPGQAPRDVKVVRAKISATQVVDSCLVAGTSIGYLRLADLNNIANIYQMLAALKKMSATSPLQGLILDLRQTSGGEDLSNIKPVMGLFTSGSLGSFVNLRSNSTLEPYTITPDSSDTSGAQKLPLVVLQDETTGGAPLTAGLLQLNGRARIVGQTVDGGVYWMWCDDTTDSSQLCVPTGVFQPEGKSPDFWKKTGVVPDVHVDGRWDQYTEANDPYLAKAIELLLQK